MRQPTSDRRPSIGEMVALMRKRRRLTQEGLALRAGRSVGWVRKIESGERPVDRFSTLNELAAALRVEPWQLTGQPYFPDPGELGDAELAAVREIRRALMRYNGLHGINHPPGDAAPRSLGEVARELLAARQRHRTDPRNVSAVAPLLPRLITDAQLAARHADERERRRAWEVLNDVYRFTASVLKTYGNFELSLLAADRALLAAEQAGDPLLIGASAVTLGHQVQAQGRLEEATELVMAAAENLLAPGLKDATPPHLSVWGMCHLVATLSAARRNNAGEAARYLEEAERAAERLGQDRNDFWTEFGPTNVAIHEVGNLVELANPTAALDRARGRDLAAALPRYPSVNRRGYHWLHVAKAHVYRRQDAEAAGAVLEAERAAPELVRYEAMTAEIVRPLLRRQRSLSPALRGLAHRIGLAGD